MRRVGLGDHRVAGRDGRGEVAAADAVEGERKIVRAEDAHRADRRDSTSGCCAWCRSSACATSLRGPRRPPGEAGSSSAATRCRPAAARPARPSPDWPSRTSSSRASLDPLGVRSPETAPADSTGTCAAARRRPRPRPARRRNRPRADRILVGQRLAQAGFSATKVPAAAAGRHSPAIRTGWSMGRAVRQRLTKFPGSTQLPRYRGKRRNGAEGQRGKGKSQDEATHLLSLAPCHSAPFAPFFAVASNPPICYFPGLFIERSSLHARRRLMGRRHLTLIVCTLAVAAAASRVSAAPDWKSLSPFSKVEADPEEEIHAHRRSRSVADSGGHLFRRPR